MLLCVCVPSLSAESVSLTLIGYNRGSTSIQVKQSQEKQYFSQNHSFLSFLTFLPLFSFDQVSALILLTLYDSIILILSQSLTLFFHSSLKPAKLQFSAIVLDSLSFLSILSFSLSHHPIDFLSFFFYFLDSSVHLHSFLFLFFIRTPLRFVLSISFSFFCSYFLNSLSSPFLTQLFNNRSRFA